MPLHELIKPFYVKLADDYRSKLVVNLEFPHFMFLPRDVCIPKDSLLRLDSIHHTFHPHLEPKQYALAPDIVKILLGQLERIFGTGNGDAYDEARSILLA